MIYTLSNQDMDKVKTSFVHFFSLTIVGLILNACASISMPQGGPKDVKPPKVLYTIPNQQQTNFTGKKLIIAFDEKIDISKLKDKVLITPSYYGEFELETSGKKLIIKLLDSLQKDKTYTIDFQDGLKDLHEGNTIKNYKLIFSTGDEIDSAIIIGNVQDTYTKDRIKNSLVALYTISDTIDPEVKRPTYYSYTNDLGQFNITGIKSGRYRLYSFLDLNKNKKLDVKTEKIAFYSDTLELPLIHNDSIELEISYNDLYKPKLLNNKNDAENRLVFNKGLYKYSVESAEQKIYYELSENKKEIIIYKTALCEDSVSINVMAMDSSYNDTTFTTKIVQSSPKKFTVFPNIIKKIGPEANYELTDSLPIKIELNSPLILEKDTSIVITNDSLSFRYLKLTRDFTSNTSAREFTYTFKKRPKKYINLIVNKKTMYSALADTNAASTTTYKLFTPKKNKDEEEPTFVNIIIKTTEKNFIVHVMNEKKEIVYTEYNKTKLTYKNMKPGKYSFRIIADDNNNKKWDTGNYRIGKQSERVVFYKNYLDVRANWDIDDVEIKF